MNVENVTFYNSRGQKLSGRLYESRPGNTRGVIFCHGLFSTKDGYKITRIARHFVDWGYNLLTFDFTYAGESEGCVTDISFAQSLDDLEKAVGFFLGRGIAQIHIMGSSMGAAVAIYFSSKKSEYVVSLITIAAPLNLVDLIITNAGVGDVESLPEGGTTLIEGVPINNNFFREVYKFDIIEAVKKIDVPVLIMHGTDDAVVPVHNAVIFENNIKHFSKTVLIEKADHNLTSHEDLQLIIDNLKNWLCKSD